MTLGHVMLAPHSGVPGTRLEGRARGRRGIRQVPLHRPVFCNIMVSLLFPQSFPHRPWS